MLFKPKMSGKCIFTIEPIKSGTKNKKEGTKVPSSIFKFFQKLKLK
jgi:hypothetical protein